MESKGTVGDMLSSTATIIVASTNPVKVAATRLGFEQMFPGASLTVTGISVPSGVSDQPLSDSETLQGAQNRAHQAHLAQPDADFWVGIEGGLDEAADGRFVVFAWVAIEGRDRSGQSRTATFILPLAVARLIRQGYELGHADDIVFQRTNSKQHTGSVGILTHDVITRTTYYQQAVVLALIPFMNHDLEF